MSELKKRFLWEREEAQKSGLKAKLSFQSFYFLGLRGGGGRNRVSKRCYKFCVQSIVESVHRSKILQQFTIIYSFTTL